VSPGPPAWTKTSNGVVLGGASPNTWPLARITCSPGAGSATMRALLRKSAQAGWSVVVVALAVIATQRPLSGSWTGSFSVRSMLPGQAPS